MGALTWKIKRWFRQLLPIALAGLVVWGGYTMFFARGGFRGAKNAVTRVLRQVPFFGSRFRSGGHRSSRVHAYRYHSRRRHHVRRSRRHHRRHR